MSFQIIELPYSADSAALFACIADLPWSAYLDSCQPSAQQGRYDILTALPYLTLQTTGNTTTIRHQEKIEQSEQDPFELLKKYLFQNQYSKRLDLKQGAAASVSSQRVFFTNEDRENSSAQNIELSLPFSGGALGYFSYDLARRLEKIPSKALSDIILPEMAVGIYDWVIIVDHQLNKTSLIARHFDSKTAQILPEIIHRIEQSKKYIPATFHLTSPFTSNLTQLEYRQAFDRIQAYIQAGDCYQVNLSQRFSATYEGAPWDAYQQLRRASPVPYAAYLHYPHATILSLSPERFLQVKNQQVETKPIKGTRPRSLDPQEDQAFAQELLYSSKDRAENLMIVDLLRNDLGKSCCYGSIKVPSLFSIESFPNVHHLVSTITGTLSPEKNSVDLLRDCFPGGSITGAPKLRAMEIIEELEPHRRGLYCGSIGYIDFNGNIDTNIAIRTLTCTDNSISCSAGGALVADSECVAEYQETLIKIERLLKQLNKG